MKIVKRYFLLAEKLDQYVVEKTEKTGRRPSAKDIKARAEKLCRRVFTGPLLASQMSRADSIIESGAVEDIFPALSSASFVDYGNCFFFAKIEASVSIDQYRVSPGRWSDFCRSYGLAGSFSLASKRDFSGRETPTIVFSLEKKGFRWRVSYILGKYRDQSIAPISL
jgi:hypothetical protein